MPIKNRRIEIQSAPAPQKLLDFLNSYFSSNVKGQVIRFAIEGKKEGKLIVNASVVE